MLLLSNLSPQILDSENKQRDHSLSVSQAAQARGRSATRRPAAGRRERSVKGSETVADNQTRVQEFTGVPNSSFCLVGSSSLALAVLILSTFIPPPSPHFKGGLEFIPDNPAQFRKWNDEDSGKCGIMDGLPKGKNRITIIRFK